METKLNINLSEGSIEISGSEEFVKSIYEDVVNGKISLVEKKSITQSTKHCVKKTKSDSEKEIKKTPKKNVTSKNKPLVLHDLELYPKDGEKFKDFFNKYELKTFFEKNLAIVHYLQEIIKIDDINLNMIYTCYKDIGGKFPEQLKQSLTDTKTQKGWLIHENGNKIQLTSKGENAFIDFKLKK